MCRILQNCITFGEFDAHLLKFSKNSSNTKLDKKIIKQMMEENILQKQYFVSNQEMTDSESTYSSVLICLSNFNLVQNLKKYKAFKSCSL